MKRKERRKKVGCGVMVNRGKEDSKKKRRVCSNNRGEEGEEERRGKLLEAKPDKGKVEGSKERMLGVMAKG